MDRAQTNVSFIENDNIYENCKFFSEGSKELYEVLIELNKLGLKTYACCKGHEEDEFSNGYVAFQIPKEKRDFVNRVFTEILDSELGYVEIARYNVLFDGVSGIIRFSCEEREEILKLVLEALKNPKEKTSEFVDELYTCSDYQDYACKDFIFGVTFKKEDDSYQFIQDSGGYDNMFLACMDTRHNVTSDAVLEIGAMLVFLTDYLGEESNIDSAINLIKYTNAAIKEKIDSSSYSCDYYDYLTQDELIKFMHSKGIVPGRFEELTNEIRNVMSTARIDINELNHYVSQYFTVMRLEESLHTKINNLGFYVDENGNVWTSREDYLERGMYKC